MEQQKKYYEAYEERYKQVHVKSLKWFSDMPSEIVTKIIDKHHIGLDFKILEIGCGEGRDAIHLLRNGYQVLATDISPTVISHCREWYPGFATSFAVLDCLSQKLSERYEFIYAVSVLHMLVLDEDRKHFFEFIDEHLSADGIALICTIGNGDEEWQTNVDRAFDLQKRIHEATGKELLISATSCRVVSFQALAKEITDQNLELLESGMTSIPPDFPTIMYAVVKKQSF